jgi:2-aminoethylphosphonate-pyruvate transaminase
VDYDIPYLLLTPGPLTTSRGVRQAMQRDYSTWDVDYNRIVEDIRQRLVRLATDADGYTSVLMQGSGTFAVEATLGTGVPRDGKVLIVDNGAYGQRMVRIAERLGIPCVACLHMETEPVDLARIRTDLETDASITHLAMVHCETTSGMLNPVAEVGQLAREFNVSFILDAMSSFGGIPFSMEDVHADYVISSANKCIQGVPGFGFVVANRERLASTAGQARSLSLDLFDQWHEMEQHGGKWRFTSPTHSVCAFATALDELAEEGGIGARHRRYSENQTRLVDGMVGIGLRPLLPRELHSPIITSFHCPDDEHFSFTAFYDLLKARRFVIYPGKVTMAETFRIGTIGHVFPQDIDELLIAIAEVLDEMNVRL